MVRVSFSQSHGPTGKVIRISPPSYKLTDTVAFTRTSLCASGRSAALLYSLGFSVKWMPSAEYMLHSFHNGARFRQRLGIWKALAATPPTLGYHDGFSSAMQRPSLVDMTASGPCQGTGTCTRNPKPAYQRDYKPGPCICRCGKTLDTSQPKNDACARHGHGDKQRAGIVELCHRPGGGSFWKVVVMDKPLGKRIQHHGLLEMYNGTFLTHPHARNPRAYSDVHRLLDVGRDVQYK